MTCSRNDRLGDIFGIITQMPITINCPECEKKLKVPEAAVGKRVRCPACSNLVVVNSSDEKGAEPEANITAAPPPWQAETPARKGPPPLPKDREDEDDDELEPEPRPKKRRRKYRDDNRDWEDEIKPHRGTTILILGALSILLSCLPVISAPLAFQAISMGSEDLSQMSSGRMDHAGHGMTLAGK